MPSTFDDICSGANRYALLTKAEEIKLARLVQQAQQPDATPGQVRAGRRAKDRMLTGNMRLVIKSVIKFSARLRGPALDREDLFQAGMTGVVRATEKFDPERGYAFSTYCTLWIEQAIRREIETFADLIRKPTTATQLLRRYRYKGEQTIEQFAEQWGYTVERVEKELHHARRADAVSMDQRVNKGDDSSSSLGELIAAEDQSDLDGEEYSAAVNHLRQACPDAMGLLELQVEGVGVRNLAELQGVSINQLKHQLEKARQEVRVNTPTAVVAMMGVDDQPQRSTVAVTDRPRFDPSPLTMTVEPAATNGHRDKLEALIADVQEQPAAEAEPVMAKPQRQRRPRRTKAQIEADRAAKAPAAIKLVIGGVAVEASAADAVTLIKALGDAA